MNNFRSFCYKEDNIMSNVDLKIIETEVISVEANLQKYVRDILASSLRFSCTIFLGFF
jgi:hypothetical protein